MMSHLATGTSERILITGATGQIGSELVPFLREHYGRDNVVATGHIRKPTKEMEDSGPYLTMDLMDQETVIRTLRKEGVVQVYHLAAILSAVGEASPQEAWDVNMTSLTFPPTLTIISSPDFQAFRYKVEGLPISYP